MGSNGDRGQMVMSYLTLRRTVGVLGVLLPVILPLGVLVLGSSAAFQDSISAYHGTVMRGVFVGVLSAIGVFLFSYVGYPPSDDKKPYDLSDNWAGNLAGASAIGVALFPATSDDGLVTAIHFVAAAILFLTLAYFSFAPLQEDRRQSFLGEADPQQAVSRQRRDHSGVRRSRSSLQLASRGQRDRFDQACVLAGVAGVVGFWFCLVRQGRRVTPIE